MRTYWQAELYRHDDIYDIDFPRRERKEDAISDARPRCGGAAVARRGLEVRPAA